MKRKPNQEGKKVVESNGIVVFALLRFTFDYQIQILLGIDRNRSLLFLQKEKKNPSCFQMNEITVGAQLYCAELHIINA